MKEELFDSALWKEFQREARKRRRDPVRLLTDYMRECLEAWEDQELDEEIRRDAQRSGYCEADAVAIVRHHRLGKLFKSTLDNQQ